MEVGWHGVRVLEPFWGVWLFAFAWLIWKSGLSPRAQGLAIALWLFFVGFRIAKEEGMPVVIDIKRRHLSDQLSFNLLFNLKDITR